MTEEETQRGLRILASRLAMVTSVSYQEALDNVNKLINDGSLIVVNLNECDELSEIADDENQIYLSINELKKKIKHTKNPMELKRLNKQLNELYKTKKGR